MASAAKKKSHGMLPTCSSDRRPRSPRQRIATQKKRPITSSTCQKPPEVEVLEALVADQTAEAAEPAVDAGELADQAAEDDDRQRAEQDVGEHVLAARLAAGDHRGEEDAGRQERGGDEEDRQLDVPGAARL